MYFTTTFKLAQLFNLDIVTTKSDFVTTNGSKVTMNIDDVLIDEEQKSACKALRSK